MRPPSISTLLSLVFLAWIVNCLPSQNPPNSYDIFDTNLMSDPVQDPNVMADVTASILGGELALFLDAEETPMLKVATSTDLDEHEDQYILDDALAGSDSKLASLDSLWCPKRRTRPHVGTG